jgi:altronate dehydratase small subunit
VNETKRRWLIVKTTDDVATALVQLDAGEEIVDEEANIRFKLLESVPFGHKFAIREVEKDGVVYKYGQVIGKATLPIRQGEHVHVHNLESRRGRGDLTKENGI